MSEQKTSSEVAVEVSPIEESVKKPEKLSFSYRVSKNKEKSLQARALDREEEEKAEELIFKALTRNPKNLRKDRVYLTNYLFTKLVAEEKMEEEEFGELWLKSARELYHIAGELARGKDYQEVDATQVLLSTISSPQEREEVQKALKEKEVSLDDFRVKIRVKDKESKKGRLLSGKNAIRRFEKLKREKQVESGVETEKKSELLQELKEVKKHSLIRRFFSSWPKWAERLDLTKKAEVWAKKHPNLALTVGGVALMAIAADLNPQEASEIAKQTLEQADIFIKSQGWQLFPLGQRASEIIQEAVPQIESFSQHQSVLMALGGQITQEAGQRWSSLVDAIEGNPHFPEFVQKLEDFSQAFVTQAIDLQDPQKREVLVEKLAQAGINAVRLCRDLMIEGITETRGLLDELAQKWGTQKEFLSYLNPREQA